MSSTANAESHLSSSKMEGAQGSKCDQTESAQSAGPTLTPARAAETDLLVYQVSMSNKFEHLTLDMLELNIRAITLDHVKWAETFLQQKDEPVKGVHSLMVMCLLTNSDETTVIKVEEALQCLQFGNHAAVSSVAFRGYTKSF
jgi:hypothetical protein